MRAIAATVLLLLLAMPASAQIEAPPAVDGVGLDAPSLAELPRDVRLRALDGSEVTTAKLFTGERPVVLVFAYSDCPMLCSLVLRGLARAVAAAEAKPGDYELVTVSIDPDERDDIARRTVTRLASLAGVSADSWRYYRGDEAEVRRLASAAGFRYRYDPETEQYAHPAAVFVLTGEGIISSVLEDIEHEPGALDAAVAAARAGDVREASVLDVVLSCFRFDPADRRHGAAITLALRIFGLVLLAAFGAGAFLFARRRRS